MDDETQTCDDCNGTGCYWCGQTGEVHLDRRPQDPEPVEDFEFKEPD